MNIPKQSKPIVRGRASQRSGAARVSPSGCNPLEWVGCGAAILGCAALSGPALVACVAAAAPGCVKCVS